jgi:sugar phosphate isomerase/epimerase
MKHSVITGSMGNLGDRFLFEGYKEDIGFAGKVKALSEIDGLGGIEISSDPDGDEADAGEVNRILGGYGLECSCVNVNIAGKRVFGNGSLGAADGRVRQRAVDECRRALELAGAVGAGVINLWPGQDGFDYPLCTDYARLYHDFLEAVCKVADDGKGIKVALEFKPREPRNRSLLDTYGMALLMCEESGRENIGVCVDVGHVLYSNANMAAAASMCAERGKLFHLHTNDCLGYWDDDMVVGSVHFIEFIELCYALRKVEYDGWCSVDIFPNRENAFECARESVLYMAMFNRMVDAIGLETLKACVEKGDAANTLRIVREKLFANF